MSTARRISEAGHAMFFDADGDNTAQALKTSAGILKTLNVSNSNVSAAYIQFFDLATTGVTVGTTTPNQSLMIPASSSASFDINANFNTAITYACTTTATGAGDPAAGLQVSATYI